MTTSDLNLRRRKGSWAFDISKWMNMSIASNLLPFPDIQNSRPRWLHGSNPCRRHLPDCHRFEPLINPEAKAHTHLRCLTGIIVAVSGELNCTALPIVMERVHDPRVSRDANSYRPSPEFLQATE
jgi:hypothetical protein